MGPVTDPIHHTQDPAIQRTLRNVVFDQNEIPRDAYGVEQGRERMLGVMQDVHQNTTIERLVLIRQMNSVKGQTGNGTVGAWRIFRSGHGETRNLRGQ